MKYLRLFESVVNEIDDGPQIGDYAVCSLIKISKEDEKLLNNFLKNNIGQIRDKVSGIITTSKYAYGIIYKNVPEEIKEYYGEPDYNENVPVGLLESRWCFLMDEDEIEYYSSNKEDVELYIETEAKKYNL